MENPKEGIERRVFLATGAVAGAAALSLQGQLKHALKPLRVGETIGQGWVVAAFKTGHAGAHIVTLKRSDTERLRVMLTRSDGAGNAPLASTGTIDLALLNDGRGCRQTPSPHVAATEALARRLEGHEATLPGSGAMLTATERQRRFRPIDHDVV